MSAFPNRDPKARGDYVRNVHPCNAGRSPDGIVLGGPDDLGMLSVQVGVGSHVYGPAENWQRIDRQPEWSTPERLAESAYWAARARGARASAAAS